MGTDAVKSIIFDILSLPDVIADAVAIKWMPHDGNVQIIKNALLIHNDFSGHDLFRRTSIYSDCTGSMGIFHIRFQSTGSSTDGGSQKIVPTGVSDFSQCVVFSQKSQNRFAASPLCSESCVDTSCLFADFKAVRFQIIGKIFRRKNFFVSQFWVIENVVCGFD